MGEKSNESLPSLKVQIKTNHKKAGLHTENAKSRLKAEKIARGSSKTWAHFPLNL